MSSLTHRAASQRSDFDDLEHVDHKRMKIHDQDTIKNKRGDSVSRRRKLRKLRQRQKHMERKEHHKSHHHAEGHHKSGHDPAALLPLKERREGEGNSVAKVVKPREEPLSKEPSQTENVPIFLQTSSLFVSEDSVADDVADASEKPVEKEAPKSSEGLFVPESDDESNYQDTVEAPEEAKSATTEKVVVAEKPQKPQKPQKLQKPVETKSMKSTETKKTVVSVEARKPVETKSVSLPQKPPKPAPQKSVKFDLPKKLVKTPPPQKPKTAAVFPDRYPKPPLPASVNLTNISKRPKSHLTGDRLRRLLSVSGMTPRKSKVVETKAVGAEKVVKTRKSVENERVETRKPVDTEKVQLGSEPKKVEPKKVEVEKPAQTKTLSCIPLKAVAPIPPKTVPLPQKTITECEGFAMGSSAKPAAPAVAVLDSDDDDDLQTLSVRDLPGTQAQPLTLDSSSEEEDDDDLIFETQEQFAAEVEAKKKEKAVAAEKVAPVAEDAEMPEVPNEAEVPNETEVPEVSKETEVQVRDSQEEVKDSQVEVPTVTEAEVPEATEMEISNETEGETPKEVQSAISKDSEKEPPKETEVAKDIVVSVPKDTETPKKPEEIEKAVEVPKESITETPEKLSAETPENPSVGPAAQSVAEKPVEDPLSQSIAEALRKSITEPEETPVGRSTEDSMPDIGTDSGTQEVPDSTNEDGPNSPYLKRVPVSSESKESEPVVPAKTHKGVVLPPDEEEDETETKEAEKVDEPAEESASPEGEVVIISDDDEFYEYYDDEESEYGDVDEEDEEEEVEEDDSLETTVSARVTRNIKTKEKKAAKAAKRAKTTRTYEHRPTWKSKSQKRKEAEEDAKWKNRRAPKKGSKTSKTSKASSKTPRASPQKRGRGRPRKVASSDSSPDKKKRGKPSKAHPSPAPLERPEKPESHHNVSEFVIPSADNDRLGFYDSAPLAMRTRGALRPGMIDLTEDLPSDEVVVLDDEGKDRGVKKAKKGKKAKSTKSSKSPSKARSASPPKSHAIYEGTEIAPPDSLKANPLTKNAEGVYLEPKTLRQLDSLNYSHKEPLDVTSILGRGLRNGVGRRRTRSREQTEEAEVKRAKKDKVERERKKKVEKEARLQKEARVEKERAAQRPQKLDLASVFPSSTRADVQRRRVKRQVEGGDGEEPPAKRAKEASPEYVASEEEEEKEEEEEAELIVPVNSQQLGADMEMIINSKRTENPKIVEQDKEQRAIYSSCCNRCRKNRRSKICNRQRNCDQCRLLGVECAFPVSSHIVNADELSEQELQLALRPGEELETVYDGDTESHKKKKKEKKEKNARGRGPGRRPYGLSEAKDFGMTPEEAAVNIRATRALNQLQFQNSMPQIVEGGRRHPRRAATRENYMVDEPAVDLSEGEMAYKMREDEGEMVILSDEEQDRRALRGELPEDFFEGPAAGEE